jgi:predicted acylesterase/phospholipase RssA
LRCALRSFVRLSHLVPGDFADLETPLAVGVVSANGRQYAVINSGKLPEAVVASAAVPVLFAPVSIPGRAGTYIDGGIKSRVGLEAWRGIDRLHYPAAVHVVGRSSPFSGSSVVSSGESDGDQSSGEGGSEGEQDEGAADLADVVIVHSTRSKSSLWNLDESRLRAHFDASYEAARLELAASHDKLAR